MESERFRFEDVAIGEQFYASLGTSVYRYQKKSLSSAFTVNPQTGKAMRVGQVRTPCGFSKAAAVDRIMREVE